MHSSFPLSHVSSLFFLFPFLRYVHLHEGLSLPLVQQLEMWQLFRVPVGRNCILYKKQTRDKCMHVIEREGCVFVCVCVCSSSVVMAAFRHHRDNEGMYSGCVDESVVTSSLTLTLWSAHGFSSLQQHRSGHSLPSLLLQVCVVWTLSESQPCSCTEVHTENRCFYITDTEPLLSVFVSLKVLCCNLGLIFVL